jgi:hypothetical protein
MRLFYAMGVTGSVVGRVPSAPMDLRAYLLDALADLRGRLFGSVINIVPTERWTEKADGGGSSVAWLLLHLARHQDLAVQTAIRNQPPLFLELRDSLGLGGMPTWAGLTEHEDRAVSTAPSSDALINYVVGAFAGTKRWMSRLSVMAMESIPDTPRRLDTKAQLSRDEVPWLYENWSGKTVNWFVQGPVLGHGHNHVGEAISVRNRLGLSPF